MEKSYSGNAILAYDPHLVLKLPSIWFVNLINLAITLLLAVLLSQFLPWWSVMVTAFIASMFITLKHSAVFFVPFLAVVLFWLVYSWWLGYNNNFILTEKLTILFQMDGNTTLLLLITGLIGVWLPGLRQSLENNVEYW